MAEMVTPTTPCIEAEISGGLKVDGDQAVGKDIIFKLTINNLTTDAKTVSADIKASSILYTRKEIHELMRETREIALTGCEEKEESIKITYDQYDGLLTPDNTIEVKVICSLEDIEGTLIIQTNAVLSNPKFDIKVKGPACLDQPVKAEVLFTNLLNQDVSDIVVTAEGSGLLKNPITVKTNRVVKPNETVTIPLTITPYKPGTKYLLVDFTCNKFQNAKGYVELKVKELK
ncbi:protein-glutamine gamma-glutamyltransferase E-like [Hyperolius riggenbachi]|uniref:protein-glutamine gamma-glutamyltransferase E-like n=1 Tax=Hyperolius riggenbachi TaxID=752182 RepID=UPI0035A2A8E3